MLRNRRVQIAGIIVFLILANIVSYLYWNWGLITVKVTDAPLGKVIKSIEWQGWVTIYTNLPADTKVTMWVDHVPLAEAMETLAANVGGPPAGSNRPPGAPPDGGGGTNAAPPGAPGIAGNGPGAFSPGGGNRGGRGNFGGGGFGGGAQWNLAFFVAPTSAQVKSEINAFQNGTTDDDTRVYSYPTPMQFVATDDDMPASDPRSQSWPGYKPPAPPAADAAAPASPDATAAAPAPDADATPTVQTYLQAFAESANVWIMAPGSWAPSVAKPPPPHSSIMAAIRNFIETEHGSVRQAIVLRVGRGGRGAPGGRGRGGFDVDAMADRMRNAIAGLPEEARADALTELDQEVKFSHDVQAAPPEQRPKMMMSHIMQKMINGNNNRRSPEKRAKMYARAVANRETAQGKK